MSKETTYHFPYGIDAENYNTLGNLYTYDNKVGIGIKRPSYLFEVNGDTNIIGNMYVLTITALYSVYSDNIYSDNAMINDITTSSLITSLISCGNLYNNYASIGNLSSGKINSNYITTGALNSFYASIGNLSAGNIVNNYISTSSLTTSLISCGNIYNNYASIGNLSAGNIVSNYISSSSLTSSWISSGNIYNNYASIGNLSAGNIVSNYISSSSLTSSWISSGNINAGGIMTDNITTNIVNFPFSIGKSGGFTGDIFQTNSIITGLEFSNNTTISFIAYITVITDVAAEMFTATGVYSIANASWSSFDLTSSGDISGILLNLNSSGKIQYTSYAYRPIFRWFVQLF